MDNRDSMHFKVFIRKNILAENTNIYTASPITCYKHIILTLIYKIL